MKVLLKMHNNRIVDIESIDQLPDFYKTHGWLLRRSYSSPDYDWVTVPPEEVFFIAAQEQKPKS